MTAHSARWRGAAHGVQQIAIAAFLCLMLWRNVAPFGVDSVAAFMPPPPPALTSNEYAKAYNEVKTVGSASSTERPPDRSVVVNFYALSSPTYVFNLVARQLAQAKGGSLSDNARSLALINMATSDALVASFFAKYEYRFWRPETAIRAGDSDGNGKTDADPTFARTSQRRASRAIRRITRAEAVPRRR